MDYSWITKRLATGAALSDVADAETLLNAGVTNVIDCRAEYDDAPLFASTGMSYLWLPVDDDGQPKPVDWFDKGIAFALAAFTHHRSTVYAHCAAGVNRGPSMAFAILLALGLGADAAEALIRQVRPQVGLAYKVDAETAVTALGWI